MDDPQIVEQLNIICVKLLMKIDVDGKYLWPGFLSASLGRIFPHFLFKTCQWSDANDISVI